MELTSSQKTRYLLYAAAAIILPALLLSLDQLTYIEDEAIRAIVALEMLLSGNYIVPTIGAEFYYNKPPLYNWIIAVVFSVTDGAEEWKTRCLTVFFLLLYAFGIYKYCRRHFGFYQSIVTALAFVTCGRILFWDSMLGLIDVFFSGIVFWMFMTVYHFQKRQNWWLLFLSAYLLTTIGFMLKGMPALVFCALTLLVAFIRKKNFNKLVSWQHTAGILLLFFLLGLYYYAYSYYNDIVLLFERLFDESAKRTLWEYGIAEGVVHIVVFPFEMAYHFLPWTLLLVYFLHKRVREWLSANDFVNYCFWVFIINLIPYWTSPEVYPRYLHMLMPLLFIMLLYYHEKHKALNTVHYRVLRVIIQILAVLATLFAFVPLFIQDKLHMLTGIHWKVMLLFIGLASASYMMMCWKKHTLLILVLVMFLVRIGFDIFALPPRSYRNDSLLREDVLRIAEKYKDRPMYQYRASVINRHTLYFLTRERNSFITRTSNPKTDPRDVYLVDPFKEADFRKKLVIIDSFKVRHPVEYFYVAEKK